MNWQGKGNLLILAVLLIGVAVWALAIEQSAPADDELVEAPPPSITETPEASPKLAADLSTFSVNGVPVGVSFQQLIVENPDDASFVREPEPINGNSTLEIRGATIHVWEASDLAYIVTGDHLEQHGELILKTGDSLEQAIARLGPYANKPGGLYFDYGPVTVQIHPTEDRHIEKFTLYYDEFLGHKK